MNLRTLHLCVTFCLVMFSSIPWATARLGETIDQCMERYSDPAAPLKPLRADHPQRKGTTSLSFKKDGLRIHVTFQDGIAHELVYSKPGLPGGSPNAFSEKEVLELAEGNKEGSVWIEVKPWDDPKLTNSEKRQLKELDKIEKEAGKVNMIFKRLDGKAVGEYRGGNFIRFGRKSSNAVK